MVYYYTLKAAIYAFVSSLEDELHSHRWNFALSVVSASVWVSMEVSGSILYGWSTHHTVKMFQNIQQWCSITLKTAIYAFVSGLEVELHSHRWNIAMSVVSASVWVSMEVSGSILYSWSTHHTVKLLRTIQQWCTISPKPAICAFVSSLEDELHSHR
jgi:hypothetical protein